MRIQQLPSNVMITGLFHLSKGKNYKDWLVGVSYKNKAQLTDKEAFTFRNLKFSNMPMLAKGRIYNATEPTNLYHKTANFIIQNLSSLSSVDDFIFEAVIDINYKKQLHKRITVKIPRLELARVLFFHNAYLATSSLQERALDLDFSVKQENGKNIITVLPSCSLSKTLFEDLGFRSKLSWLLLNHNIKNSYYSIYQNLVENKTQDDEYDKWKFNFTPPPLKNLNFKVKGYLKNNEILYVDEIISISGIESGIVGEVEFIGDIFTQVVLTPSEANTLTQANTIKTPIVSDEHHANSDMSIQLITTPSVTFEFLTPIISSIKRERKIKKPGQKPPEENDEQIEIESITVATDEATTLGSVRKGEFKNTEDITPRDTQYRQNFIGLIECLEKLDLDNLTIDYHELPKLPNHRLHRKKDGNRRVILQAKFHYRNHSFMAFEVDITDLEKKRLPTLIVRDNNDEGDLSDLLEKVVKGSLSWSKISLNEKITVKHPKDFYSGVVDLETMIKSWSERILSSLNSLIS